MGWLGELASSFTGKASKDAIREGTQNQISAYAGARDQAVGAIKGGGTEARGYMQPYVQQGSRSYGLYNDTLGVNGADARARAQDLYNSDDMAARQRAYDLRQSGRMQNASGNFGSGTAALADSRIRMQGYGDWQNRLAQNGQLGFSASGNLATIAQNEANALAAAHGQYGQGVGNAWGGYGQSMAQASNAFGQNVLGGLGIGIQGFTPGKDGNTPFGNMASSLGKGANFLGGIFL